MTTSSIEFPRAPSSTDNHASAAGMHRSTDHFFDTGNLNAGGQYRSTTNQRFQARKDIPLKIDPNVESKASQRQSSRRSNTQVLQLNSTSQAMHTPIGVEAEYFQQKARMPWATGPSETTSQEDHQNAAAFNHSKQSADSRLAFATPNTASP